MKFYNESFGFRPNRNCHQAVREIIEMVQYRKTNYVVEADIRSFFDNVDHEWMMKMLSHDIADRKFLEIIENLGDLPDRTEKQEGRENQIPLIFLASRFIVEWTERNSFSVVG